MVYALSILAFEVVPACRYYLIDALGYVQVAELQDDLLVGLAVPFEGCDAGTSHVLRCTKILQDVLDISRQ